MKHIFFFFFFGINTAFLCGQGASLSLKHIVHRPIPGFTKTARMVKANALGGIIDFDVNYQSQGGNCMETYRVQWKFDQDMSKLNYGEAPSAYPFELRTERINGDCGAIRPWRNPFVVAVANDVSTSIILNEQGYDEVSMAKGISGGSGGRLFIRNDDWVRRNQAPQGFVRNRFLTKKDLNSYGKYSWFKFTIIGNSNQDNPNASFQYELVYVYDVKNPPPYLNVNTLTLGQPMVNYGIGGEQGQRGVNISVPGELAANSGEQFHLEARFEDARGIELYGNPNLPQFTDNRGHVVSSTPLYVVPPNAYRLEQLSLWMPYRAFRNTGQVFTYVELWIDGEVAARSPKAPVVVR